MRTSHRPTRTNAVPHPIPRLSDAAIPSLHQKGPLSAQKIPAPYNVPWTGHLIKRDLKDLNDKFKAKAKSTINKLLGKSKPACEGSAEAYYKSDKFAIHFSSSSRDDDRQDSPYRTRQKKLAEQNRSIYMQQNSGAIPPTPKNPTTQAASNGLDSDSTDNVIADLWADFDGVHFDEDSETDDEDKSVYETLMTYLNKYWEDRPKDEEHTREYITHEERFRTRGLLVLLRLLVENCPSNPIFADLNKGQECFDELAFKLELKEEVNVIKLNAITSNLARYRVKVSKLPSELNHKQLSSARIRLDSLLTEEEKAKQIEEQISAAVVPSPSDLWYAIMVACCERSMTQKVVGPLLHLVEPEMDVDTFLVRVGNPAQMVPTEEKNVLRKKMLPYLFPHFDGIF